MLAFQWNALRVGDRVRVHDDRTDGPALHDGAVVIVQTYRHRANDVAVRLDDDASVVLHPRRQAVHLGTGAPSDACWRCGTTMLAR